MSLSSREASLAIIPKITGGLSMISSGLIAYKVISNETKRNKTYHRLMAVMSIVDIISSFCYFLSTWPIPQGENLGWRNPHHYAAFGTEATCTAQGVGIQFGVTSAILNVMLSVHYLLVIRYNYTEASLKKLEPYFLSIAFLFGLGLTIPGIFTKMYGNTNLWCWISANFSLCEMEGMTREACVLQAYNNRWGFYYGPLWACISIITIAQFLLFSTVYKMEAKASKWRKGDTKARQFRQSRQVATQAAMYVGVFYVTWLPYTSIALTGKFFNPHSAFGVLLLVVLCQPSQGIFNLIVYRRKSIYRVGKRAYKTVSSSRIAERSNSLLSRRASKQPVQTKMKLPTQNASKAAYCFQDATETTNVDQSNTGHDYMGEDVTLLASKANDADREIQLELLEFRSVENNSIVEGFDDEIDSNNETKVDGGYAKIDGRSHDYDVEIDSNENIKGDNDDLEMESNYYIEKADDEENKNIIEIYGDD